MGRDLVINHQVRKDAADLLSNTGARYAINQLDQRDKK
jgi:hypothetical protein